MVYMESGMDPMLPGNLVAEIMQFPDRERHSASKKMATLGPLFAAILPR